MVGILHQSNPIGVQSPHDRQYHSTVHALYHKAFLLDLGYALQPPQLVVVVVQLVFYNFGQAFGTLVLYIQHLLCGNVSQHIDLVAAYYLLDRIQMQGVFASGVRHYYFALQPTFLLTDSQAFSIHPGHDLDCATVLVHWVILWILNE